MRAAPARPASCAVGEYCIEVSGECAAKQEDGAICSSAVECASGVCSGTTCGPLLPNGASCQLDRDCASGAWVGPSSSSLTCGAQSRRSDVPEQLGVRERNLRHAGVDGGTDVRAAAV